MMNNENKKLSRNWNSKIERKIKTEDVMKSLFNRIKNAEEK